MSQVTKNRIYHGLYTRNL